MHGLIGKMRAQPGKRDALIALLLEGTGGMPGCLSYVVAADPSDADAIWITEVWTDEASHKASLSLPAVQAAIAAARPMIAGFDNHVVTEPAGWRRPGTRMGPQPLDFGAPKLDIRRNLQATDEERETR